MLTNLIPAPCTLSITFAEDVIYWTMADVLYNAKLCFNIASPRDSKPDMLTQSQPSV